MNGWIGVTDNEWFTFLSGQPGIDEVNDNCDVTEKDKGCRVEERSENEIQIFTSRGGGDLSEGGYRLPCLTRFLAPRSKLSLRKAGRKHISLNWISVREESSC
jgi:hypothetical protein